MSDEFSKAVETSFDAWLAEDSTHWIGEQDAAWQAWMYVHEQTVEPLNAEIARLKAECEGLRESLTNAADEVESWGAYASDYFQQKYDLAGTVLKIRQAAMSKKDTAKCVAGYIKRGDSVERVERVEGDPQPEWICRPGCNDCAGSKP